MLPTIIAIAFRAKTLAGQAFTWLTQSAVHMLIALCVALAAWGWLGWHGKAKAEKVLASTEQALRTAQKDAKAAQEARDRANINLSIQMAENADAQASISQDAARVAVADYARAHPVRLCGKAPGSVASGAGDSGLPRDPGQFPESPGSPELVAIARPDLDALASAAVQGASQSLFLNELVAKGYAVPLSRVNFGEH